MMLVVLLLVDSNTLEVESLCLHLAGVGEAVRSGRPEFAFTVGFDKHFKATGGAFEVPSNKIS